MAVFSTFIQSLDSTNISFCSVCISVTLGSSTYEITKHGKMMIMIMQF